MVVGLISMLANASTAKFFAEILFLTGSNSGCVAKHYF